MVKCSADFILAAATSRGVSANMIPHPVEQLWANYLSAERVRIRQHSLAALDGFMSELLKLPVEVWHPWARDLAQRVVDQHEEIPIRLPLFRTVIFPALFAALKNSEPGAARCLAGFAQLLYKSPDCREQLPDNERSEYGLLARALQDDPNDASAKAQLLRIMRSHFEYVLHELPSGVLYGHDSATIEQCGELLEELENYERLAAEFGEEEDREVLAEARFHIPAYRKYLSERERYANYADYLADIESA